MDTNREGRLGQDWAQGEKERDSLLVLVWSVEMSDIKVGQQSFFFFSELIFVTDDLPLQYVNGLFSMCQIKMFVLSGTCWGLLGLAVGRHWLSLSQLWSSSISSTSCQGMVSGERGELRRSV